jgi:hypothetical protein
MSDLKHVFLSFGLPLPVKCHDGQPHWKGLLTREIWVRRC